MSQSPKKSPISRDPEVHSGDLVFTGTRVPVQTLIDCLKGGASVADFLEGFPTVNREQVLAFLDLSVAGAAHLGDIEKEWRQEAARRVDEIRSGKVKTIPGNQVFAKARRRLKEERETVEGIQRGLSGVEEGSGQDADEAFRDLDEEFGVER